MEKIKESVDFIQGKTDVKPEVGIILGSGLGPLADEIEGVRIPYGNIPHFSVSKVPGHKGNLVIGELEGKKIVAMQGRSHYYEGHSLEEITYPVRVMKELGAEILMVTNAGGGINKDFGSGDLMIITDHINFMGANPLRGRKEFIDMTFAYDKELVELTAKIASEQGIEMKEGVYIAVCGPSYETPSEIKAFEKIGADAVGMSTVPEVIVAKSLGMRVLGLSCITNMAAGILKKPLSHKEVIETTKKVEEKFKKLVREIIKRID
ncbi:purine-nucleoside phosphorylase [bacterium]|nr:purine-nucleoside phosphorylase [bacterium]MCG2676261.1 purine-nucleoside phosphorylase [bacterium]MCG2677594.1 purine-nucleoside phosphorylase [bacterium]